MSKTTINVSTGKIWWNFVLSKFKIVLPILDFERKISWLHARKLPLCCRNCTCVSWVRLEITFFWKLCKFFLSFFNIDWFIFNFGWFFSARFPKLNSTFQTSFSRKNFWCENFFFIFFTVFGFEGKKLDFWRQLFGSVVKIAIVVREEQIERSFVLKICKKP